MEYENIALKFFDEFYQINDRKNQPLVNIYTSYADKSQPVYGTVYLMHGYAGSPVEFCLKVAAEEALKNGFDVIALEGVALSATYLSNNKITEKTLPRHESAIIKGLEYCKENPKLAKNHNIAWAHSISGRALVDLVISNEFVRGYFKSYVMNNPYILAPSKLKDSQDKFMEKDPTGKFWNMILHKSKILSRVIEGVEYKLSASPYNFSVPLPSRFKDLIGDIAGLANYVSDFIKDTHVQFILGKDDTEAEYDQNKLIFNSLNTENKVIHKIPGGNHYFESAKQEYIDATKIAISGIRAQIVNAK